MVEKANRFIAFDGRSFVNEDAAHYHEAVERLIGVVPELALIRVKLETNITQISDAMESLVRFRAKTTLEGPAKTTLEPCCVNTPRGQEHHTDCPGHPEHQPDAVVDLADRLAGRA